MLSLNLYQKGTFSKILLKLVLFFQNSEQRVFLHLNCKNELKTKIALKEQV